MLMTIIIAVLMIVVATKVGTLLLKACGVAIGIALIAFGYMIIGGLIVGMLGATLLLVPIIMIIGIIMAIMALILL